MTDRLPNRPTDRHSFALVATILASGLAIAVFGGAGCATSASTQWAQTSPTLPPDARPVATVHLGAMNER